MFNNNISENIQSLRLKNNLTQTELATKLGISRQALSNYEKGLREPDISTLAKIATFFNCSIDFLVFNNTKINISDLYKCHDSFAINEIDTSIINFLKSKKIELESIKNSIPKKIQTIDNLISTFEKDM